MKDYELSKILELHRKWLNAEEGGARANLQGVNLQGIDLHKADLRGANLCGADLRKSNLCEANFFEANLYKANLCGANLLGSNLRSADLRGADLCETKLQKAELYGACLWGATNIPYIPLACPEHGSFTAFKKCGEYIVELLIPADAKRSSATTHKCRASYAKVLSITTLDGKIAKTDRIMNSIYFSNTVYKVGEYVYPDAFDENRWKECSHGIHFFINRQDAVEY